MLLNTRITIHDENSIDRPTVAGLLAFSTNIQEYLSSAYIEAAVYRGFELDSNDLIHSQQISGDKQAVTLVFKSRAEFGEGLEIRLLDDDDEEIIETRTVIFLVEADEDCDY